MLSILELPAVRRQAVPISVETYHLLGERGLVGPQTELLRGVILEKLSKSPLHVALVIKLMQLVAAALRPGQCVRKEDPLTLADSEPEPDIAVVAGAPEDFSLAHPRTALLVVEVAITTEEVDRAKTAVYAEAGVAEYWLVLPALGLVEVHTQPAGSVYAQKRVARRGDTLASSVLPELQVELEKLFA